MSNEFISYDIDTESLFDEEGNEVEGAEYWLIEKIYVPVEKRGQGIARRMMSDAIKAMKAERPGLTIKLWCEAQDDETDSELLASFYESFGFEATGNGAEMEM
ncbi:TPA: GNAT family N-acetyltransferase [Klebsiella pneumoniae]|uniref:GNAT family N-acetyltransferase n=1 Tax=Klebsiella pneumoniae TaxID=573 RepID=UPI001157B1DF|nr:GNAT family N-acetyltransferase [Klebsiella pneumoniae]HBY0671214.1 N-acetyltransferase [Klebsiella pneumoniae subsp. pneumoniae]QMC30518.1 GNAT family N-acetyltransferase [Klebsiella pneumoniae]HBQ8407041.1 GNAT family N-acetyltransferase [Klebsiella pneumoniae]HBR2415359.1 GNAT family N-acetyltransferase [Klebsiella pneumoniae]HCA6390364.1 GNAT family N-acetyltransferase [Klebsiella pneumoniae]